MSDQFAEIRDHFLAALERDGLEAQLCYAAEHCADNPGLHEKLADMLRAHHQADGFLASSVEPTHTGAITEKPGSVVGPYKLLQQIGEGGFGVVYMAEQTEPVERRVALKIIKPGMDTRQVIARFESERQALALMDHPHIAKVLDAGTTETGRPYFVMELVKGLSITQYCDEQQLTPRERLELFLPVCHAVQHAHQKGIIHRDLKPSNILVAEFDDKAVPKIIDFGVAKAVSQRLTEKTMFTQYGQIVGTIEYMSPEQAKLNQLDVDTRSDIYSLGVLLYELLTGETPFDRQRLRTAAFDELLRIIREEEPPRPSTRLSSSASLASIAANRRTEPKKLSTLVRDELDWIVMKALEKDRSRRYETANAFATDVQRFLSHEPVAACPPSPGYRLRKFARRNRAVLTTSLVVCLSLVVGAGAAIWQAIQATYERDRAVVAEDRSAKNLERALNTVDTMLTRVADEKLANAPYLEGVRRELYEDALAAYQQILEQDTDDPEVRLETAIAQRRVAMILEQLGRHTEARTAVETAADMLAFIRSRSPGTEADVELGRLLVFQAGMINVDSESAIDRLQQTATLLRPHAGEDAGSREAGRELAHCLYLLATKQMMQGRRTDGAESFAEAERIYDRLLADDADDRETAISYAKHLNNYGNFFVDAGQYEQAESKYGLAVEITRRFLDLSGDDAEVRLVHSVALMNVGKALFWQEKDQRASDSLRDAVDIQRKLVRDFPAFPDYRIRLSNTLMSWCAACVELHDYEHAVKCATEGIETLEYLTQHSPEVRTYHEILGGTLSNLAYTLLSHGAEEDLEHAEELAQRAIEEQRKALVRPDEPNLFLLKHYLQLIVAQERRRRFPQALDNCKEALRLGEAFKSRFPDNPDARSLIDQFQRLQGVAEQELQEQESSREEDGITDP